MDGPKLTIAELKNIHPVESIAPYGIVLIMPSQEFNRDEIADLTEENKIIYSNYQGKSSVFIKLPPKQPLPTVENSSRPKNEDTTAQEHAAEKASTTVEPMKEIVQKRAKGGNNWKNVWQLEEDKLLIELWKQKSRLTVREIAIEFQKKYPQRTEGAVGNRLTELQRVKTIEPRWHLKTREKRELKKEPKHWIDIKTKKTEEIDHENAVENAAIPNEEEIDAFKTIIEAYEKLNKAYLEIKNDLENIASSKAYIEIKTELENLTSFIQTNLAVKYQVENLQRDLIRHKHIKETGEAAIPLKEQK